MEFGIMSILTDKCNFSCRHCSTNSGPDKNNFLEENYLINILEEYKEVSLSKKHLVTGGETFLYPHLNKILTMSRDFGYDTNVITNASWINLKNLKKSKELFYKSFPEGVHISASIDYYHLECDSNLIDKVHVLSKFSEGRNKFSIDGCYNGDEQFHSLNNFFQEKIALVPLQNLGRGKNLDNKSFYEKDKKDIFCPKADNQGFVVSPSGIYYCYSGALNNLDHLKISDNFLRSNVDKFIDSFHVRELNLGMRGVYFSLLEKGDKVNGVCDLCNIYFNSLK